MSRRPFDGPVVITTEYGTPQAGTRRGYHTGVDYALNTGTPILAPENGVIQQNGDGRASTDGRGYFVLVKGDSGVMHCLYHLSKMGTVTGRVSEGQLVGYSGNTGFSTGPHLHWETRKAPYDGNSDFAPGSWLFAGQTVYTPPVSQPALRDFVRIFGDFRSLYKTPGTNKFAQLSPNQFGGHLDYMILERSGNFVKIQTQMYGQGWIYVGPDVASLTQYFKA
ncbi:MAG: M23 family metallopeptidase [Candidatus Saccharimonadales bacterium]